MDKNIRIKYVRDYQQMGVNPNEQVLTVVTRLNDDNTVSVGWSINNPPRIAYETWDGRIVNSYLRKGDRFTKKKGLMIALSRLESAPIRAALKVGERPMDVALEAIENEVRHSGVQKLLRLHHAGIRLNKAFTYEKLDYHPPAVSPAPEPVTAGVDARGRR